MLRVMKRLDRKPIRALRKKPTSRLRGVSAVIVLVAGLGTMGLRLQHPPEPPGWPDRPADASDSPLGRPPEVTTTGSFAFVRTQPGSGEPVTYAPCVPIHVVVNHRTAVPHADRILRAALEEVSLATGLQLVVDGSTDAHPDRDRSPRASDGWRPVLVAWSDPAEVPDLKGRVAGVGGSTPRAVGHHEWFVTGTVALDGPALRRIQARDPEGEAIVQAVVMHELGHVVGLTHVDDRHELMQPHGSRLTTWGAGDRRGLAALGSGACVDY
jgi:hypothetical protein